VSNPLKYVTSTPTGALRHANLGVGVASIQYDETFNSGITPYALTSYYLVYEPVNGASTRIYAPADAAELIKLAQSKGSTETTEAGALAWLSNSGYYPANKTLKNIVTDELIFYMDASTITSYPTSGEAILDLSGDANDGTLTNGPEFNSDGYLDFDGVDDYLTLGSSATSLVQGKSAISMGIIFKLDATDSLRGLIGTLNYGCSQNLGLAAHNSNINFYNDTGTCYSVNVGGVEIGKWLYAVGTYDGTTTRTYLIKEGTLTQGSGTGTKSGDTNEFTSDFRVMAPNHSYRTNGQCVNAFVYNKALSEAEILQNYFQGPIVTDNLKFSLDASNLISFEPGTTAAFSLTGSLGAAAGDGVLTNGVSFSNSSNGAWDFDGVDDYIAVSNLGLSSHTMEGWINSDDNTQGGPTYATIVSVFGNYDGGSSKYTYIGFIPQLTFRIDNGVSSHANIVTYDNYPDDWFHVALTYDATSGKAIAYLNGEEIGSTTSTTNITFDSVPFNIARSVPGGYFDGSVAQSMVYDRALTPLEIQQNYNANVKKFT